MKRTSWLVSLAVLAPLVLSGCAATVALEPAADATNVDCAAVVVHLPSTVSDEPLRETNAQGTGAWGTPSSVLLKCGVDVPAPTAALPCVLVGSVYWLRDDTDAPNYAFTTYGRDPATTVYIDQDIVTAPGAALLELENAVSFSHTNGHECSSIEDSLNPDSTLVPTATPTPTPVPTN